MARLVSFLNVGSRVASSNENVLLFGANCKEEHQVVRLFAEQLKASIAAIERKSYTVLGKKVTFILPSLMGNLIMLLFFSSFANVLVGSKIWPSQDCVCNE